MKNQVIILAGGKGVRMKLEIPKVLCVINGVSLIDRVIKSASSVSKAPIIIIGHKGKDVINHLGSGYDFVWQKEQLGTGHAVSCAKDRLVKIKFDNIVILPGDHPCISQDTVRNLVESHINNKAKLTLVVARVPNYKGVFSGFYNCGRIIRDKDGRIRGIAELKDRSDQQRRIKEINVSYYCFNADWLWSNIGKLSNKNKAKEYYLTDLVSVARKQKRIINSVVLDNLVEGLGVNSKEQLDAIINCMAE